jgi:WD40 repeat protein/tRNA A-37 threonylcarbamoyl transferase component Bud32
MMSSIHSPPSAPVSSRSATWLGHVLEGLDQLDPIFALPMHPEEAAHPFGRFVLRCRLGAGRFGIVILADDPQLGRRVVVKVPQPSVLTDPEMRERFTREARTAARLEHPDIVPVLEAGEHRGLPYLVAAHVRGPSLAKWLATVPGPKDPRFAARLVLSVAEALRHAHDCGVLHCDLSPSNLLLDAERGPEPAPLITDFGLARLLDDDPALTRSFQVAGTPAYMAPEQARGERRSLTARADIHSLGAILHELITGRAERGIGFPPDCPRDLVAICLKCLELDPDERYSTATELADDLRRFLNGDAVSVRPWSAARRSLRWIKRHPVAVGVVLAAVLVTAAAIGATADHWARRVRLESDLAVANTRHDAALQRADGAEFHAGLERMRQRRLLRPPGWVAANQADAARLARHIPEGSEVALRSEAAAALGAIDLGEPRVIAPGFNGYSVAFDASGDRIAIGGRRSNLAGIITVKTCRVEDGGTLRDLNFAADRDWEVQAGGLQDGTWALAFSPDGRWLAGGTRSGWVNVWNLAETRAEPAGRWRHPFLNRNPDVRAIRNRSVSRLAWDDKGRVWSGDTLVAAARYPHRSAEESEWHHGVMVRPAGSIIRGAPVRNRLDAESPTADWFVCRMNSSELLLTMLDDSTVGRLQMTDDPRAEDEQVTDFAISPDGTLVAASAEFASHVKLWEVGGSRLLASRVLQGGSLRCAFRPDSGMLAVSEADRTLLFPIRKPVETAIGVQARPLSDADITPDAHWLAEYATGPQDFSRVHVSIRDLSKPVHNIVANYTCPPSRGNSRPRVAISPDGKTTAIHSEDDLLLTRFPSGVSKPIAKLQNSRDMRYAPDGVLWVAETVTLNRFDGENRISVRTAADITCLLPETNVTLVGLRDGSLARYTNECRLLDSRKLADVPITALAFDGERTAIGTAGGEVIVIEADGTLRPPVVRHTDSVNAVALGWRGWCASASADHMVRLRMPNGELALEFSKPRPVRRLLWSTGGSTLWMFSDGERGLRRWDLDELQTQLYLLDHGMQFKSNRSPHP